MKVTVSPYHRSVTIDGVEVRQKILEFPNALNHLASISCTYDKNSNTVVELSDMHRYVSHFTEREYFNTHLPEFVEWYYAEKQAQIEEEARVQQYKEDVENATNQVVEAGKEVQANIATDKADALSAIAANKQDAITSIQSTENGILTNIANVGETTLSAINSGKNTALSEIVNTKINATTAVDQLRTEAVNNITALNTSAIQSITDKQQKAEASIEVHRNSAQNAVDATGRENQEELVDKGTNYLNQTKEQVELAKEQVDKAKEAADRAIAVAEVGPATRNTLGLVKVGRGLEVNEEGLIEVRSSVTMLAPVVEAPEVLPLGYNSVFTMQAYPGLGRTNIKQYRCTLENVGTQVIDANSETGVGTVIFVVPKAIGENKTLKLTVVAIDTLDNESLPTELSRLTARAFVNPPMINSPSTDTIIYPLEGFTATSGAFRTTALADTHESTDWVIAKDNQANVIVVDIKNTSDLYSHTFTREELANKVLPNQTYYVFARYHGAILGVSELGSYKGIHAKPDTINAPVISSPEALDVVYPATGFIAETNSEFETIGTEDTHVSTDWYVTSDKEGKNIVASCLGSTDLKTHKFTPTELHNLEERLYYVFCRFNGRDIGAGQISDYLTIVAREAYIKAPVLNQRDYASVYPTGGIELSTDSVFESFGITDDTHKDTDWFIYQREDGIGIVAQALHSADLYSHTFPANSLTRMEIGRTYYVAARFNGEKIETGRLSAIETIATKGSYIHAPVIRTPVFNQDVYRAAGFTVTTNSVFKTTGVEDEHVSSDWIISRDVDGLDIVVSAMGSEDLTSHTFTSEDIQDLEIGESYYILMRFNGNAVTKGNTSEAVKVTVQPAAIKAPVINNPEDGASCYYLGGLEVSTDTIFETIGLDADEHISSDWIIAKDSDGKQVLVQALDSSDLKSHFFSVSDLEGMVDETDYYVFVRYNGATISKGILSEPVRVIAKPAYITAPTITSPDNNSDVYKAAGFTVATSSNFIPVGTVDNHISTDWILTRDIEGKNVIIADLATQDLKQHTFTREQLQNLTEDTTYYVFCRFNGLKIVTGNLSQPLSVINRNAYIDAPVIDSPVNDASCYYLLGLTVSTDSVFSPIGVTNDTHKSTDWYITSDAAGNNVIAQAIGSSDLKSYTFPASALTSMQDEQTYYAWCRFNGNIIPQGLKSSGVRIIAKKGYVNTPTITAPQDKSKVYIQMGFTVSTDDFSTTGADDTHKDTDWMITTGADRSGVIAQALTSTDKLSHTFPASSLDSMVVDNNYYVHARHRGDILGESPWATTVEVVAKAGYVFAGRLIYRHPTLPGSVIEYNEFGTARKILVFDAVYRSTQQWALQDNTLSGLKKWNVNYYPTTSKFGTSDGSIILSQVADLTPYESYYTDAHFQEDLSGTFKSLLQTAKEATDILTKTGSHYLAAWWCRWRGQDIGIEGQLPNLYQLLVLYACGDIIDNLDPTVAANPTYALGWYGGVNDNYRWCIGGKAASWSSMMKTNGLVYSMRNTGYTYEYNRSNSLGVTPIAEL